MVWFCTRQRWEYHRTGTGTLLFRPCALPLAKIEEQTPRIRPVSFSFGKQSSSEPSFQQLEIVPLSSPALLAYLQERGINIAMAKENAVKRTSPIMANGISPSPFPMCRVGMKSATSISRDASHRKRFLISNSREQRGKHVMCLRDLWTIFHFLLWDWRIARNIPNWTGKIIWCWTQ